MRFLCRTDKEEKEIVPSSIALNAPFYAKKDEETLGKLISCWAQGKSAFPVNPRLLQLPSMPGQVPGCATFLFTSGSTAIPKIACLSFENYFYSAKGSNERLCLEKEDRWLLSLPLFHVGGIAILFRCALAQARIVISDLPLLEAILFHKITHLSLVPTQLYRFLQEDAKIIEACAQQLKVILIGGAPCAHHLLDKARQLGLPVHCSYGLTEMSSQVTMDPFSGALPYRELKIAEDGEILVKGKTLFQGYYEGQMKPLSGEWFATRDVGHLLPDGRLRVIGRKDNLFISGGENIQPEEIEAVLMSLPGIIEAIVVPKADQEFGMRPFAFITKENDKNNFKTIQDRLKEKLPSYKIPIKIALLPSGNGLKRNRKDLAQLAQELY